MKVIVYLIKGWDFNPISTFAYYLYENFDRIDCELGGIMY